MSGSNWRKRCAAFIAGRKLSDADPLSYWDFARAVSHLVVTAILAIVLTSLSLNVWSLYQSNSDRYRNDKERAKREEQQAYEEISKRCAVPLPSEHFVRGCLIDQLSAYTKQKNTDEDLKAQQDMAFWAFAMFVTTVFSLIVSVGGLLMLFASLRQTRTAIKDNREIGVQQTRAFIVVSLDDQKPITSNDPNKLLEILVKIENVGQSPARNLRYIAFTINLNLPLPEPCNDLGAGIPDAQGSSTYDLSKGAEMPLVVQNDFTWGEALPAMQWTADERFCVAGIVSYEDVFGGQHKKRFCFVVRPEAHEATVLIPTAQAFGFYAANAHNDET